MAKHKSRSLAASLFTGIFIYFLNILLEKKCQTGNHLIKYPQKTIPQDIGCDCGQTRRQPMNNRSIPQKPCGLPVLSGGRISHEVLSTPHIVHETITLLPYFFLFEVPSISRNGNNSASVTISQCIYLDIRYFLQTNRIFAASTIIQSISYTDYLWLWTPFMCGSPWHC